jgi:hypothetical protein
LTTEKLLELRADPEFHGELVRFVRAFPRRRRSVVLKKTYLTLGRLPAGKSPEFYFECVLDRLPSTLPRAGAESLTFATPRDTTTTDHLVRVYHWATNCRDDGRCIGPACEHFVEGDGPCKKDQEFFDHLWNSGRKHEGVRIPEMAHEP